MSEQGRGVPATFVPGEASIIKMWDSLVDRGIGELLKPWQIRRVAAAETDGKAKAIVQLAQAEHFASQVRAGKALYPVLPQIAGPGGKIEPTLRPEEDQISGYLDGQQQRLLAATVQGDVNVGKAILHAERAMLDAPKPPSEKTFDPDWLDTWRDCAAKSSTHTAQLLWGRLLAAEAKTPGYFSLRTLDFLRLMSAEERDFIIGVAPFLLGGALFYTCPSATERVSRYMLKRLTEMGVLLSSDVRLVKWDLSNSAIPESKWLDLFGHDVVMRVWYRDKIFSVKGLLFSSLGTEVVSLVDCAADQAYLREVEELLGEHGCECFWAMQPGGQIVTPLPEVKP